MLLEPEHGPKLRRVLRRLVGEGKKKKYVNNKMQTNITPFLIGRTQGENARLVAEAGPNDWWVHANDYPSRLQHRGKRKRSVPSQGRQGLLPPDQEGERETKVDRSPGLCGDQGEAHRADERARPGHRPPRPSNGSSVASMRRSSSFSTHCHGSTVGSGVFFGPTCTRSGRTGRSRQRT